jgi:hypothetical protein
MMNSVLPPPTYESAAWVYQGTSTGLMGKIKNTKSDIKAIHEDEHGAFRTRQQADKT